MLHLMEELDVEGAIDAAPEKPVRSFNSQNVVVIINVINSFAW